MSALAVDALRAKRRSAPPLNPAYSYEDFVRGVVARPGPGGQLEFQAQNKLFAMLCAWAAQATKSRRAILVIDEINRADVARVFGELVVGIERDKRGMPIETPYAITGANGREDATLTIPENLWIIGTMNATDRSVVRFDMALRRRFSFIDILAGRRALEAFYAGFQAFDAPDWHLREERIQSVLGLYEKVLRMFRRDDGNWNSHGRDYALGPSFFMIPHPQYGKKDLMDALFMRSLRDRLEFEVLPQLQEYQVEGVPLESAGLAGFASVLRSLELFNLDKSDQDDFYARYGDLLGIDHKDRSADNA